jgi:hypothetical protein
MGSCLSRSAIDDQPLNEWAHHPNGKPFSRLVERMQEISPTSTEEVLLVFLAWPAMEDEFGRTKELDCGLVVSWSSPEVDAGDRELLFDFWMKEHVHRFVGFDWLLGVWSQEGPSMFVPNPDTTIFSGTVELTCGRRITTRIVLNLDEKGRLVGKLSFGGGTQTPFTAHFCHTLDDRSNHRPSTS